MQNPTETCWFCDGEIKPGEPKDYMAVGWERPRKGGGANQIKKRERVGPVAHPECTDDGRPLAQSAARPALDLTKVYRAQAAKRGD